MAYLEALPPEGWTEQSAADAWQVYQVVSHIGSQPAIHGGMIRAGLRGEPPMTDDDRRAIWGRFDVAAALQAGQLRLSDPGLAEALQALLPGR